MKFFHKLVLTLCAFALLPLGVISILFLSTQQEMLTVHLRESHLALAQSLASQFQYTIQHVRRDLTAAGTVLNAQPLGERDVLALLDAYLKENAMVHAVGMYDADGMLIETLTKNVTTPSALPSSLPSSLLTLPQSSEPDRTQVVSTVWWSIPQILTHTTKQFTTDTISSNVPIIPIVVVVRGNRFSGRLVVVLSSKDLVALLNAAALRAFGIERGLIHCVDSDYRLVASTEDIAHNTIASVENLLRKQFFSQDTSHTANNINDTAHFVHPASQNTSYFQSISAPKEYTNARGEDVIATRTTIPYTNLSVIIEQPRSVVYKPLRDIRIEIVLLCFALCGGAFGFGLYIAAQFMRPLRELTEASNEIHQQNFHIRLHRNKNDEFAAIFGAYNEAVNQLEHYQRLDVHTLLLERNKLEVIMRQATQGILVLTPEKIIMLANDTFANYLQQDPVSLEGKSIDDALQKQKQLLGSIQNAFDETADTEDAVGIQDFRFAPLGESVSHTFQITLNRIMLDRQFVAFVISFIQSD